MRKASTLDSDFCDHENDWPQKLPWSPYIASVGLSGASVTLNFAQRAVRKIFVSHNVCTNILVCSSVTMSAPTSWCVRHYVCTNIQVCLSVTMSAPTPWCVRQSLCLYQHPSVFISHNVCTNTLVCSSVTMSAPTSLSVCQSVSAPTSKWTNMLMFCSVTMSAPTSWCVNSQCLHQHPSVFISQCLHQHLTHTEDGPNPMDEKNTGSKP